jgi:hypothetical protein
MASDGGDEVCFMLRLLYPLRSKSPIPTGQKNESAEEPAWMQWEKEKSLAPTGIEPWSSS